jgi:iron complex outermembrane recepter protein
MKKFALCSASAFAMIVASPAYAQDPTVDDDEVVDDGTEIIVTATKRETTLQETPVAVSVTTADQIERAQVRDLIDMQTLVPSLKVGQLQSSQNTNFVIRGFGNGANNAGIEPSVGVFIDGVYRSRSAAQIGDLPNLKRVEVLRGPQSTLFGKNASAGVISIVTEEPQDEFGGSAELSYGNYNAIIARADVTGPIAEGFNFSIAGGINKRDGYVRDLEQKSRTNERDRWYGRAQLLLEPSSAVKLRMIADYDKIDEVCCAAANISDNPLITGLLGQLGGRIDADNPFSYNVYYNFPSTNKITNSGISLQGDFELGAMNLTSISAYRKVKSKTNADSDFTSADLIGQNNALLDIKTITQELRLSSDFDGPLNFLIGGFFFDEKIKTSNDLTYGTDFRGYANGLVAAQGGNLSQVEALLGFAPGTFQATGQGRFENFRFKNTAYSLFGTVDFKISEALTLTGGLNYTNDKKRASSNVRSTDVFSSIDLVAAGAGLIRQQGLAAQVGTVLNLGRPATAAEITAFAGAQPTVFGAINTAVTNFANASANTSTNPLLGLRSLQFLPPFLNFPNAVEDGRTRDSDLSYTARLAWEASDNLNLYASYATGYKASSWNLSFDSRPSPADFTAGSPVTNPAPSRIRTAGLALPNLTSGSRFAEPEHSSVIELGLKAKFDGLSFNLTLFDQTLKNFQSNIFLGGGFALLNAEKQSTSGIEFDALVTPTRGLNFTFAMTYLSPKYDKFTRSGVLDANGNVVDLSGERPAGVPAYSIAVGGNYRHEFGNGSSLTFGADFNHDSNVQVVDNVPGVFRETNLLNANITYALDNGLQVSLWGRNITKDKFLISAFPSVAQAGSLSGYPNQPRTYGVSAKFKF